MGYKKLGFTIIELLVVIAIIGILAAITLVSYSGVTNRANITSLSSDLASASTQLKMFSIENSSYPSTISTDCVAQPNTTTNKCLKASINTTYSFSSSPMNRNIFCLEATKSPNTYSIAQDGKLLAGPCPILNLDAGSSLSYPGDGGGKWYDLSGNDNNGTLNGGVTYSPSNSGSMGFDGINGHVSFPAGSISSINGTNSFSINFHARMYDGSTYYPIFNKGLSGVPQKGFTVHGLRFEGGNGISNAFDNTISGLTTSYRLYTVTYDGAFVKLYINSAYVSGFAWPYGFGDLSSMPVYVGRFWGPYGKLDISDFIVYDTALTPSEILQNFNATKARYGL